MSAARPIPGLLLSLSLAACAASLEVPAGDADLAAPPSEDAASPAPADGAAPPPTAVDAAVPRDLRPPPPDLALACPPGGPQDCSPGPGSGEPDTCQKLTSCFFPAVRDSVVKVMADHPEWFDKSGPSPHVLKPEDYMNAVVANVKARGLCAIRDPNAGDEIAVKHDNRYAESFDILAVGDFARWGAGIYTATCAPAWF
jgi:hypothetical protein